MSRFINYEPMKYI
ncbi:hypothetical protein CAEBREN_09475 [Caenorhabditis brenneri]|uniref:Uncharacterized protein n=1 Tax=Caenorhabditis brenneri TaxID=135651 RepID=G0N5R8_CAEBE|nr:hypothetical protein CAEBREN_09475 [Caenorhabditis brenneri]